MRPSIGLLALVAALAVGPTGGVALATAELAPRQPAPLAPRQAPQQDPEGEQPECANAKLPPPPVDTSEVPPPGEPSPKPLPVPDEPVGGEKMGSCGVVQPPGSEPIPAEVGAQTWVLADMDSGEVLAAKDPHGRQRPASVIKVLTALVAIRDLDLQEPIVATQEDADQEGSKVGLQPDQTYTVQHVLSGLIMQSGNDAAHALARKLGGPDKTVEKMNKLAAELGAKDTRAATPSGLDGPGMSTSAYDMALLFREAMTKPAFAKIAGTTHTFLPGEPPIEVYSDNQVLLGYEGALGGKTGFTDDARHTYIAAAERDGRKILAILLRGENTPLRLSAQTEMLLDYGFALPQDASVGKLTTAEERAAATKTQPTPVEPKNEAAPPPTKSTMFGTVGGPLTAAVAVGIVLLGLLTLRQRRAKKKAAARRAARNHEHP